ncbi:MAG: hypothetical protein NUV57_02965, partial [archaeon]|nr:hypothetical protein [archaeon]
KALNRNKYSKKGYYKMAKETRKISLIAKLIIGATIGATIGALTATLYGNMTSPTRRELVNYELGITALTKQLNENGIPIRDVCRGEYDEIHALFGNPPIRELNPLLAEKIQKRLVVLENGASIKLEKYLNQHPEVLPKIPLKKLEQLDRTTQKIKNNRQGIPERNKHLAFKGALGGVALGAVASIANRKKRIPGHRGK